MGPPPPPSTPPLSLLLLELLFAADLLLFELLFAVDAITFRSDVRSKEMSQKGSTVVEMLSHSVHVTSDCSPPVKMRSMMQSHLFGFSDVCFSATACCEEEEEELEEEVDSAEVESRTAMECRWRTSSAAMKNSWASFEEEVEEEGDRGGRGGTDGGW